MADRRGRDERRDDDDTKVTVAEVRTAIGFVVQSVERLEESIGKLERTVREDFATTGELELVKVSVQQLREDLNRRLNDMLAEIGRRSSTTPLELRIIRWTLYVGVPMGLLALVKFMWDLFGAAVKRGMSGTP